MQDGFQYEHLTSDERRQIIDQRLKQYEAEHYAHRLNRLALEQAVDVPDAEKAHQIEQIDRALQSIEGSIRIHRDERDGTAP